MADYSGHYHATARRNHLISLNFSGQAAHLHPTRLYLDPASRSPKVSPSSNVWAVLPLSILHHLLGRKKSHNFDISFLYNIDTSGVPSMVHSTPSVKQCQTICAKTGGWLTGTYWIPTEPTSCLSMLSMLGRLLYLDSGVLNRGAPRLCNVSTIGYHA